MAYFGSYFVKKTGSIKIALFGVKWIWTCCFFVAANLCGASVAACFFRFLGFANLISNRLFFLKFSIRAGILLRATFSDVLLQICRKPWFSHTFLRDVVFSRLAPATCYVLYKRRLRDWNVEFCSDFGVDAFWSLFLLNCAVLRLPHT